MHSYVQILSNIPCDQPIMNCACEWKMQCKGGREIRTVGPDPTCTGAACGGSHSERLLGGTAGEVSSRILLQIHAHCMFQLISTIFKAVCTHGTAGEEHNALEPTVVEEVVERPEAAVFSIRIRCQIRIVAEDVTLSQSDLTVHGSPQAGSQRTVGLVGRRKEVAVHGVHHPVEAGLAAELVALGLAEVVVRVEGCIQGANQVEQRLAADGVTQLALPVITLAAAVQPAWALGNRNALRRGQSLQVVRTASRFGIHGLEQPLVTAHHLTGVALNPSINPAIACLEAQGSIDGFEAATLQELHGCDVVVTVGDVATVTVDELLFENGREPSRRS